MQELPVWKLCDHHAVKAKGELRCRDCGARYVIEPGVSEWRTPHRSKRT